MCGVAVCVHLCMSWEKCNKASVRSENKKKSDLVQSPHIFISVIFPTRGEKTCHRWVTHCFYLSSLFRALPVSPLLLRRGKTLHFLLFSPPSPSIRPRIIPWLLSTLLSSRRSVLSHPSGSIPLSRCRTARDGDRLGGFLTLFLSLTPSHQISISFPLMRLLNPSSSLFPSLSVPLNLSFVFARFVSSSLFHSVPCFPSMPHSSSLFFTTTTSPAFHTPFCFYGVHPLTFSLSSGKSQEEQQKGKKVPQFLKELLCCRIVCASVCFNRCN